MSRHRWTAEEQAILMARSRALATAPAPPQRRASMVVVRVTVSGERYAIDATAVRHVGALRRITPLPFSPPEVAGLIAHQGQVLPAFHLRALLDLPLSALPEHGRAVFVGRTGPELALVVDTVTATERLALDELTLPPQALSSRARELIAGIDPSGVAVLGAEALLSSPRLIVDIEPAERPT